MQFDGNGIWAVALFVALAIVAYFVIKGLLKLFYSLLCLLGLALGGLVGFAASNHYAPSHWPDIPVYGHYLIACVCALLSFFLIKFITNFLYDPVPNGPNGRRPALFTIIAGVCLLGAFCAAIVIISSNKKLLEKSPEWVKSSLPSIQDTLGDLGNTAAPQLKQAITEQYQKIAQADSHQASDTLSQITHIRIADPQRFARIAKDEKIKSTLEHPKVKAFLDDPEVREKLKSGDISELMLDPKAQEILADPELQLAIKQIDIEQVLKLR